VTHYQAYFNVFFQTRGGGRGWLVGQSWVAELGKQSLYYFDST